MAEDGIGRAAITNVVTVVMVRKRPGSTVEDSGFGMAVAAALIALS